MSTTPEKTEQNQANMPAAVELAPAEVIAYATAVPDFLLLQHLLNIPWKTKPKHEVDDTNLTHEVRQYISPPGLLPTVSFLTRKALGLLPAERSRQEALALDKVTPLVRDFYNQHPQIGVKRHDWQELALQTAAISTVSDIGAAIRNDFGESENMKLITGIALDKANALFNNKNFSDFPNEGGFSDLQIAQQLFLDLARFTLVMDMLTEKGHENFVYAEATDTDALPRSTAKIQILAEGVAKRKQQNPLEAVVQVALTDNEFFKRQSMLEITSRAARNILAMLHLRKDEPASASAPRRGNETPRAERVSRQVAAQENGHNGNNGYTPDQSLDEPLSQIELADLASYFGEENVQVLQKETSRPIVRIVDTQSQASPLVRR